MKTSYNIHNLFLAYFHKISKIALKKSL